MLAMLRTIVNANPNTAQLFFLVALVLFAVGTVMAISVKTFWAAVVCAGLFFSALGLLFFA
jgi:hypothetical protein